MNIVYFVPFISFRTPRFIWITSGTIQELSSPTLIIRQAYNGFILRSKFNFEKLEDVKSLQCVLDGYFI
jgi:hypothetical protein